MSEVFYKRIVDIDKSESLDNIIVTDGGSVKQITKEKAKDVLGISKLSEEISDLKENGSGTGNGATTAQANSLWIIIQKSAFAQQLTDAELNEFKTAWGIGGEVEPDIPEGVTLSSISVTYTGGDVYAGALLTDLTGIIVTANYSDGSTANVNDYTLSGEILEGSNTITVSYGGKTTTFTVTGVAESSGGETTGVSNETTWTSGVAYEFEPIINEYPDKNTGEIKPYNNWERSPYLYCAGASTLRGVVKYQSAVLIGTKDNAFYDADKNYVAPIQEFSFSTLANAEVGAYVDIPIPENAVYFIVSGGIGLFNNVSNYTNNESYIEYIPYE